MLWCNGRGSQGLTAGPPPKDLRVSARRSANTHRRLAHNEVAKADAIKQVVEGLNLDLDVPDEAVESVHPRRLPGRVLPHHILPAAFLRT